MQQRKVDPRVEDEILSPEAFGDRERLVEKIVGRVMACQPEVSPVGEQHLRLLRRRRPFGQELHRLLQPLDRFEHSALHPEELRQHPLRRGCTLDVPRIEQRRRGAEQDVLALLARRVQRGSVGELHARPLGLARVRQRQRALEVLQGVLARSQCPCPHACLETCVPRQGSDLLRWLPRRLKQLQRRAVVVGEHLGAVLGAIVAERADPGGRGLVLLRAGRSGDLVVGDVAHEHVPERVLGIATHRAAPRAADELPALE